MPPKGQHPKRGVRIKSARVRLRLNKSEKAKLIKPIAFNNLSPENSLAPLEGKYPRIWRRSRTLMLLANWVCFPKFGKNIPLTGKLSRQSREMAKISWNYLSKKGNQI